jgi:hypothetical protein
LLDGFAESLGHQVAAIRLVLREPASAGPEELHTAPINGAAASDAIASLRSMLEASDSASEEAFHSLQNVVKGAIEKSKLDALGASINDFDFETALVKLNEIAEVFARNGGEPK